jgi:hypothetical protein
MNWFARLVGAFIALAILIGIGYVILRSNRAEPYPCAEFVIVTEIDTIESIAARCGVDVNRIYELNPSLLEQGAVLEPGMVLRLTEAQGQILSPEQQTATAQFAFVPTMTPLPVQAQGGGVDVPIGFTPIPVLPTVMPTQQPVFIPTSTPIIVPVVITATPIILQPTSVAQVWTATPFIQPTAIPPVVQQPVTEGNVQVIDPRANNKPFCSDATLPVAITTPADDNTLRAAYETLLSIDAEEVQGGYNALRLSDLRVDGVSVQGNTATVQLSGTLNIPTNEDVCAAIRMHSQLTQTALAYPNITSIVIFINGMSINTALQILN